MVVCDVDIDKLIMVLQQEETSIATSLRENKTITKVDLKNCMAAARGFYIHERRTVVYA